MATYARWSYPGHADEYREVEGADRRPDREQQVRKDDGTVFADGKAGKSGGIYIPSFKLARMMKALEDKSNVEYQRLTWDALRKSINGLVKKVNSTNIKNIILELLAENLIRGRGLFCRSCMKSQMASPGFTDVFAALIAVVNTKIPQVGNLLLRRIILQLKRAYKRKDKDILGVDMWPDHEDDPVQKPGQSTHWVHLTHMSEDLQHIF